MSTSWVVLCSSFASGRCTLLSNAVLTAGFTGDKASWWQGSRGDRAHVVTGLRWWQGSGGDKAPWWQGSGGDKVSWWQGSLVTRLPGDKAPWWQGSVVTARALHLQVLHQPFIQLFHPLVNQLFQKNRIYVFLFLTFLQYNLLKLIFKKQILSSSRVIWLPWSILCVGKTGKSLNSYSLIVNFLITFLLTYYIFCSFSIFPCWNISSTGVETTVCLVC